MQLTRSTGAVVNEQSLGDFLANFTDLTQPDIIEKLNDADVDGCAMFAREIAPGDVMSIFVPFGSGCRFRRLEDLCEAEVGVGSVTFKPVSFYRKDRR